MPWWIVAEIDPNLEPKITDWRFSIRYATEIIIVKIESWRDFVTLYWAGFSGNCDRFTKSIPIHINTSRACIWPCKCYNIRELHRCHFVRICVWIWDCFCFMFSPLSYVRYVHKISKCQFYNYILLHKSFAYKTSFIFDNEEKMPFVFSLNILNDHNKLFT